MAKIGGTKGYSFKLESERVNNIIKKRDKKLIKNSKKGDKKLIKNSKKRESWVKRLFRSRKVKVRPGEVVRNEYGIPKPCYKNYGYGDSSQKPISSCSEGEFCADQGEKAGFCVYKFSPAQIRRGRREIEQMYNQKEQLIKKTPTSLYGRRRGRRSSRRPRRRSRRSSRRPRRRGRRSSRKTRRLRKRRS